MLLNGLPTIYQGEHSVGSYFIVIQLYIQSAHMNKISFHWLISTTPTKHKHVPQISKKL